MDFHPQPSFYIMNDKNEYLCFDYWGNLYWSPKAVLRLEFHSKGAAQNMATEYGGTIHNIEQKSCR